MKGPFLQICWFSLLIGSLTSCISNRDVVFFQDAQLSLEEMKAFGNSESEYRIQPKDVLSVQIKTLDPTASDYLNLQQQGGWGGFDGSLTTFLSGFSISDSGYIHLPYLGKIKVDGLTTEEARALIQRRVDEQLLNATVLVSLVSFKVAILGEVNAPGYYYIYNNRGTILDAIALARGMREFADRKHIMLIRQKEDGTEATEIDLTQATTLSSPYYFLKPNDAIIVRPMQLKHQRSNLVNLNIMTATLAGISTAVSIISVIELIKQ